MELDFTDFYIAYPGHPRFNNKELVEDEVVRVIIQKYEMILFTNKGELLGDPNFGADLERLLHNTMVSSETVKDNIIKQISLYIPELNDIKYELDILFYQDPENYQDVMEINFKVREYEINATIK